MENRSLIDRRVLRTAALLFLVGFVLRIAIFFVMKPYHTVATGGEMRAISVSVAQTGVFGNPYSIPTGPTAHSSPVYPWINGEIYHFLGSGDAGEITSNLVNIFEAALVYALIPMVAAAFELPLMVGLVAGLAGAVLPVEYLSELRSYEPLATILLLLLTIVSYRTWQEERFSFRRGLLHGLAWGLLVLTQSTFLLVLLAWLAAALFLWRRSPRSVAWYAAGVLLTFAAANLPWAIRNYYQLGELVLFRSNLGIELYNSNNPLAHVTFDENVASHLLSDLHPSSNIAAAEHLAAIGEPAYSRECTHAAVEWMKANPVAFLRLTFERVVAFWFPYSNRRYQGPILGLISFWGLAGLIALWRVRPRAGLLIALTYLTFPPIYYLIAAQHRYKLPLQPFLLLGAACLVMRNVKTLPRKPLPSPTKA